MNWYMIFLVLLGKMIFLFLENLIYSLDGKRKMIFLEKNTWKYHISFKCSERMVVLKNCFGIWFFLYHLEKWYSQKHDNFLWTENERWCLSRNTWKYDIFHMYLKMLQTWYYALLLKISKMIFPRKNTLKGD